MRDFRFDKPVQIMDNLYLSHIPQQKAQIIW